MNKYFLLPALLLLSAGAKAQGDNEKLLVNETFQSWSAVASSTTETSVTKTTSFSNETLIYKLREVQADPTGHNADRFSYTLVSDGWLMAAKTATPYIELSPLASITRVEFVHGATGSNRGYQLWKKAATDADWVSVSSAVASPASGATVAAAINETNVAIKLTNLNAEQNAYLFDLKIWGNYASSAPQVSLNASVSIDGAGEIARNINSDTYDQGSTLRLTATANFGYRFVSWTNGAGAMLTELATLELTLNEDMTVVAVFEAVPTYSLNLNIEGSRWGELSLAPAPTNGRYEQNTIVTATVIPNAVATFLYWDDQTSSPTRSLQVTADVTLTATFDEIPFIVGWNFKVQEPRTARAGDFYSETANTGIINLHEPSGATVNWLANTGSFSPSYTCARKWTSGITDDTDFATPAKQRYFEASFATTDYTHIRVSSLMGGNYHVFNRQIMQYSLTGEAYTNIDTVDIGAVYNSGWAVCEATLPSQAENQPKVYIRWVADLASGVRGNATDNDGTALTNIFVYADKTLAPDFDAPLLVSASPAQNSTTASSSGTITLSFNERMKAGTGNITLDGQTVSPVFGSTTVTLRYSGLGYGTEHTLIVPAAALSDLSDNPFAGLSLNFTTMTRPQPIQRLFDAVVAADGSGQHLSLQAAIDAAPTGLSSPWLIYVKNGVYRNQHTLIPVTKPYLHFIGQCRDSVIVGDTITNEDAAFGSYGDNAAVVVRGASCYFENMTLENTHGYTAQAGPQALAVFANADKTTFNGCTMRGYQDTYFTGSYRHYLLSCRIEGAVDFIYGSGDAFFDQCLIYVKRSGSVIVAPNHGAGTAWGYVFSGCTIDGDPGFNNNLFGRPWQNSPKAVFLNTTCKASITPAGWTDMGAVPIIFADYGSTNAQGELLDLSQRTSLYPHSTGSGVA
ncbi:MAG: Ig-like domain-containing protein, partial [Prevotellaceae bacterium]|nr:Ig-like domain-containing protein [Prevotellaceae bacterium]